MLLFALISEFLYLFFVFQRLQTDILDLHNNQTAKLIVFSLLILFVLYFYTYYKTNWIKVDVRKIIFISIAFHVTFLLVTFLTSDDIYSYISAGRLITHWGKNPYLTTYDSVPFDEFYKVIKTVWSSQTTLYGPLLISSTINLIGLNNLPFTAFLFKFVLSGANVVNVFLIYKISKNKKATFLYSLNPLVIFELAGNGHTESLLILSLLISIFLISRRQVVSFAAFTSSVLIKYSTLIVLPLYLIYLKKKDWKTLIIATMCGFLIVVIGYSPFWNKHIFDYLIAYYNGRYISPSSGIFIGQALLGSYALSFRINTLLFFLISGVLLKKFLYSKSNFRQFVFYSFLLYWVYILTKLSLVLTWYLTPLVALGSLCITWKKYHKYAMTSLLFVSIYSLILYYFVR